MPGGGHFTPGMKQQAQEQVRTIDMNLSLSSMAARDGEMLWVAGHDAFTGAAGGHTFQVDLDGDHAVCVDLDDHHAIVGTSKNRLYVFAPSAGNPTRVIQLPKCPTVLCLPGDEHAVVCDRFGDVFRVCLSAEGEKLEPKLRSAHGGANNAVDLCCSHLQLITAACLLKHAGRVRLLATADNGGTIRISRYPEAHVPHSYCMGHGDFITCLAPVQRSTTDLLLSASADRELCLWNPLDGTRLQCVQSPAALLGIAATDASRAGDDFLAFGHECDDLLTVSTAGDKLAVGVERKLPYSLAALAPGRLGVWARRGLPVHLDASPGPAVNPGEWQDRKTLGKCLSTHISWKAEVEKDEGDEEEERSPKRARQH